ncbi:hypothetical protein ACFCZN_21250, partial [Isoptericola sp. NPDC056134]
DTVTYTITATNPTNADYPGANLTDDMSKVLDDATIVTSSVHANVGTATFDGVHTLTWRGDVPAGTTATITYQVKVATDGRGDHRMTNAVVQVADDDGGDPNGNCPAASTDPNCVSDVPTGAQDPALTITKNTDTATAEPGDHVGYVITVTNPTNVEYTDAHLSDDLARILDDATFDPGSVQASTGQVGMTKGVLGWSVDLAPGATATLRYTVTVNHPDTGDRKLLNTVVADPGTPGTNCSPSSHDKGCTTSTEIRPAGGDGRSGLAITGSDTAFLALGAVVLLAAGGGIVVSARRRRTS